MAEPTLRRLVALKPTTIALMHGPTFKGDGVAALEGLADLLQGTVAGLAV